MVAKLHLDWRKAMTYSTRIRHHLVSHQMARGGCYRSTQLPVALLLGALVLLLTPIAWAKTEVLTLRWSEVGAAVAGGEATIVLSQGTRLTGSVSEVRADMLIMPIRKTSDKNAYARGQASIPRVEVAEIRIKQTKGPGRLIGAAGLGTAAGLGSIGWAISDSRINVDDSTRIIQWAGITAAATVGGYFIGRLIDTRRTIIRIAPEPRADPGGKSLAVELPGIGTVTLNGSVGWRATEDGEVLNLGYSINPCRQGRIYPVWRPRCYY